MELINVLKETITNIVKKTWQKEAFKKFETFMQKNPWPANLNKDRTVESIQQLVDGKLDLDLGTIMIDMMAMQTRKAPKLTSHQKKLLQKMQEIIKAKEVDFCPHKKFGVAVFMHGGGFTPNFAYPELMCTSCGLNFTIFPERKLSEAGIKISNKHRKELIEWATKCEKDRNCRIPWIDAEMMIKNPVSAYEKSDNKWPNEVMVKVVDYEKLQSKSGT